VSAILRECWTCAEQSKARGRKRDELHKEPPSRYGKPRWLERRQ
jgi:hypothetical protein